MAMKTPEQYLESLRDGRELVTILQAGGGLAAQKIVTYRVYDLNRAKDLAKKKAGIDV